MHHAIGIGLLIYVIVIVFGKPTARLILGAMLLFIVLAFVYVMFRIVTGTI